MNVSSRIVIKPIKETSMLFHFLILVFVLVHRSSEFDLEQCNKPLGMESGQIQDWQLSSSSNFDLQSTGPTNARIEAESGGGAWCPMAQINATLHEWVQVEFPVNMVISAVKTQGRWDKGKGREYTPALRLEYWRESPGMWSRYVDGSGSEIIKGNVDTSSSVLRRLNGGIVGKLFRLVPVSETTRTVCLRFELFGCPYRDNVIGYVASSEGTMTDDLDLRDLSFDGETHETIGLGRLYDGALGDDDFELRPQSWVGWRREEAESASVNLTFTFERQMNLSAVSLHVSNLRKRRAGLFRKAKLEFWTFSDAVDYSFRVLKYEFMDDVTFENARWVRLPVPFRLASKLRIELSFSDTAELLLLSEVAFETESQANAFKVTNTKLSENVNFVGDQRLVLGVHIDSELSTKSEESFTLLIVTLLAFSVVCVFIVVNVWRNRRSLNKFKPLPTKFSDVYSTPTFLSYAETEKTYLTPSYMVMPQGTLPLGGKKMKPYRASGTQYSFASSSASSSPPFQETAAGRQFFDLVTLFPEPSRFQPCPFMPTLGTPQRRNVDDERDLSNSKNEYADLDYAATTEWDSSTASLMCQPKTSISESPKFLSPKAALADKYVASDRIPKVPARLTSVSMTQTQTTIERNLLDQKPNESDRLQKLHQ